MREAKFACVVLDPPWNERGGGKIKRGADKHYPLMKLPQIKETVLKCAHYEDIADNAHMYMWVTNNFLSQGLDLMATLNFEYKTNIAWFKPSFGLGQYFRGQHELCLFGVRGKGMAVRTQSNSLPSVVLGAKTGHSRKPEAFMALVERRSKGPYLELFARQQRPNWVCWGNQLTTERE